VITPEEELYTIALADLDQNFSLIRDYYDGLLAIGRNILQAKEDPVWMFGVLAVGLATNNNLDKASAVLLSASVVRVLDLERQLHDATHAP
jgi:hypothetical protein